MKCLLCKSENLKQISSTTFICINNNHIFPDFKLDYSNDFFKQFIDDYLNFIPKIFPYTIALRIRKYFENDFKRIFHAINVANFSEFICKKEKGDLDIVLCAGYLHDIGIKNAELKYNSNAPKYQEIEGPPVAREILEKEGCDKRIIDEVCNIIAHHHSPGDNETINFMCLYDADLIVNWIDGVKERGVKIKNKDRILNLFFSETGRILFKNMEIN